MRCPNATRGFTVAWSSPRQLNILPHPPTPLLPGPAHGYIALKISLGKQSSGCNVHTVLPQQPAFPTDLVWTPCKGPGLGWDNSLCIWMLALLLYCEKLYLLTTSTANGSFGCQRYLHSFLAFVFALQTRLGSLPAHFCSHIGEEGLEPHSMGRTSGLWRKLLNIHVMKKPNTDSVWALLPLQWLMVPCKVQLVHDSVATLWLLPWAPHCYSTNTQMGIISPMAAP